MVEDDDMSGIWLSNEVLLKYFRMKADAERYLDFHIRMARAKQIIARKEKER